MLYSFGAASVAGASDGERPAAGLIDVNGTLYGTTDGGGTNGRGTVYSVSTNGKEKVLYSFRSVSDAAYPRASLLNVNGMLYGTTDGGGASGRGTVYSISTSGTEKVLHSFRGHQYGGQPIASLIDVKGTLYGTTSLGDGGTVFSITRSGRYKVLHLFRHNSVAMGGLLNVYGTLYGTTTFGGNGGYGSVFSVTRTGAIKTLYDFEGAGGDGAFPEATLINVDGTLYGTTYIGGTYDSGSIFSVTTSGTERMLHSFEYPANDSPYSDGAYPAASLVNVHGTLYGTTYTGGAHKGCTVFAFTP